MNYRQIFAIAAIVGCMTGCATQPKFDSVYKRVSPANIQAGQAIPTPKDKPLITITGEIKAQNSSSASKTPTITMDRASLQAVGLVEYEVKDFFELKVNRFRGVLMRDLLALWQVPPEANQVTLTALNDYKVTIPIKLMQDYPILLALEQNGNMMQPDYRGPAMIVTPHQQYSSVKALDNQYYWIWQIATIHIE
jgi:hypothetical protein